MMYVMDILIVPKALMNTMTVALTTTNITVDMLIIVMNQLKSTLLWSIIQEVSFNSVHIINEFHKIECIFKVLQCCVIIAMSFIAATHGEHMAMGQNAFQLILYVTVLLSVHSVTTNFHIQRTIINHETKKIKSNIQLTSV